jgi:predicted dinucleotide-utilizing enzyme
MQAASALTKPSASDFFSKITYLPGAVGGLDRDKNARPGIIKLIKVNTFRAFLAAFKRRALRRPAPPGTFSIR